LGSDLPNNAIGGSADPVPDIKANGSDGPISVPSGTSVSLVITLDAATAVGTNADWWVLCDTPFGWYYDNLDSGWQPGISVTYQGPLGDLPPYEVLNAALPDGAYKCYFGVDLVMNGAIDLGQLYHDSVDVNIVESECTLPVYEPWKWNDGGIIQYNNNCYNYGNDEITGTFAQPGKYCGDYPNPMECTEVYNAAACDGLVPSSASGDCPAGMHKVYLVVWPNRDYHWYRLDSDTGRWSHKPGSTKVRDYDSSGQAIYNPDTADISPYTNRCGYMCACGDNATIY
jgi:hypothetical protein